MKLLIRLLLLVVLLICLALLLAGAFWGWRWYRDYQALKLVAERLSADSRIAQALVTDSSYDEVSGKIRTTVKFLEYDTQGNPLAPRFFTFLGNVIQFQSLVVRFDDQFVRAGDALRGKSAYLFLRAFVLDDGRAQIFNLTETNGVPRGYQVSETAGEFEKKLWQDFWLYALDPQARAKMGIKNAQIEAPGTIFVPGTIYTLKIEHDGGIRIDTQPIPEILKGELKTGEGKISR